MYMRISPTDSMQSNRKDLPIKTTTTTTARQCDCRTVSLLPGI